MVSFARPKFYPRAQINGSIRWTCVYCGYLNTNQLTPVAFKLRCKRCAHVLWHGSSFHAPAGAMTNKAKDAAIPKWIADDDEFTMDALEFDPMPEAFMDPSNPIKQRGRVHMLVVHRNVWISDDDISKSPEECEEIDS